jgi:hypothetical protein
MGKKTAQSRIARIEEAKVKKMPEWEKNIIGNQVIELLGELARYSRNGKKGWG